MTARKDVPSGTLDMLVLRTLSLGPISLQDVEALVAKPGSLKENLLGMSFLSRLRSYEFTSDFLMLRG